MLVQVFDEMKHFVGFSEEDAELLTSLYPRIRARLPEVVDRFYATLSDQPALRPILHDRPGRIEDLKKTLRGWLTSLFGGQYGEAYFHERCRIGQAHVRVQLPQQYMFTGMNVIRVALIEIMHALEPRPHTRAFAAVHKILDLDLAIMNQTYREDLVHQMRQTEQARYEQRISESEHLATIGQLAASLAHEIKNPLAGISGAIQILGAALDDGHPHKEIIGEALHQIDRLDEAVKDLLIYARPKPPTPSPVSLASVIEHALMLLREEPSFRRVRVHCAGMDGNHLIFADETQMQQLVTNLLLNAAHACERGGEICCRLARQPAGTRLEIEDSGVGMPPEVLARVFEPFYTTKAKGTGLGLSICKRIVEAHGGTLDIQSRPGVGSLVTVEIPDRS